MAQIVAKAMAKGADCDKLAAEFADELDTLGVRVAKLEKGADAVKITGEIRYHYADHDFAGAKSFENTLRSRLWFAGQINDDWKYTAMLENQQKFDNDAAEETTNWQRAYLNGKLGGMAVLAGRYNLQLAQKAVLDHRFDGAQFTYGKDVKLMAGFGKQGSKGYDHVAYGELSGKIGVVNAMVGYYDFQDANKGSKAAGYYVKDVLEDGSDVYVPADDVETAEAEDKKIWAIGASMPVAKNVKLNALYLNGEAEKAASEEDGYQVSLAYKGAKASVPGSWGLEAFWYDLGNGVYVDHTHNGLEGSYNNPEDGGFEGYSIQATYALAKNIVAKVEWYDLEAKKGTDDSETLWTQVVFTF